LYESNAWYNTATNSAYYLLEYRFLDSFGNVSEYSSPITIPIVSKDSGDPISITSFAGYSGLSYLTGLALTPKSPRTTTSALSMTSGTYSASNVTRPSVGSDSLVYSWQPVTSGSDYSYDVYLSWKTGLNPPVLSTTAYISNYSAGSGTQYTATLTNLNNDAASNFIVGQYIEATDGVGGPAPSLGSGDCYVEAINLGTNTVDVVFPTGGAISGAITNVKSKRQTWLPFQFAGTTKANSFSFQIKDIVTGGTNISDVQFVQAMVSLSTYPKYQNDYINWQTIWSLSPAFSTWQTPNATLSATTNSSGGAHTSTLTIDAPYQNPYPTNTLMAGSTNAQIVAVNPSGNKIYFTVTGGSGTSITVRTSSSIAASQALTSLSL
jgi:hypothetical protein